MSRDCRPSLVLALCCLCAPVTATSAAQPHHGEVRSLTGKVLLPPDPIPDAKALEERLARAKSVSTTEEPEALITIGRSYAYLWRYHEAIDWFTKGIATYPDDARLYRHRGHRYITIRKFDMAREDLERAAALMDGRPDQVEPDLALDSPPTPRTTNQFNVWYHLGLVYYLQGTYDRAADAFRDCLRVSRNDDTIVAATDWLWMTLMRLGRRGEAAQLLERITPAMDIRENTAYHRRLLMYKGVETPEALLAPGTNDPTMVATQGYGVANYYLVRGDTERARTLFEQITAGRGWNAFGYIAAEADLARMLR